MAVEVKELYQSGGLQISSDDDMRVRIYHLQSDSPSSDNARNEAEIAEHLHGGGTYGGWRLWYGSLWDDDPSGAAQGTTGQPHASPVGILDPFSKVRVHNVDIERIGFNSDQESNFRLTFQFSRKRTSWQPKIRIFTQEKNKRIFRDLNAEDCPAGLIEGEEVLPCDEKTAPCINPPPWPPDCDSWFSFDQEGPPDPHGDDLFNQGEGINRTDTDMGWEFTVYKTIFELHVVRAVKRHVGSINANIMNIIGAGDVVTSIPIGKGEWKFEEFEAEQIGDQVYRVTARFLEDKDNHYVREYRRNRGTGKIIYPVQCVAKRACPMTCYDWVLSGLLSLTLA